MASQAKGSQEELQGSSDSQEQACAAEGIASPGHGQNAHTHSQCKLSCLLLPKISPARQQEMKPQGSSDRRTTLASRQHLKPLSVHLETSFPLPTATTLSSLPCSYLLSPLNSCAGWRALFALAGCVELSCSWQCSYDSSSVPSKAASSASSCPVRKEKIASGCTVAESCFCSLCTNA